MCRELKWIIQVITKRKKKKKEREKFTQTNIFNGIVKPCRFHITKTKILL